MEDPLLSSWARSKRAENRSQATIDAYLTDTRSLVAWLAERHLTLTTAQRRHIEDYLASGLEAGLAPATVARRFRSFQQFYRWAEDEDEITPNPMARMKPPKVVVPKPEVITADVLTKLLASCDTPRGGPGRSKPTNDKLTFENKRDRALILLLSTTGVRAGELMNLTIGDVDLDHGKFQVIGKGGAPRNVKLLPKPAAALDRYLRARARHAHHDSVWLWLGDRGRLTDSGLRQMLERRCEDAGVPHINPHRFRHTFAHEAKKRGMRDEDLMAIAGWSTTQMLQRYGASAREERAHQAHEDLFGKD